MKSHRGMKNSHTRGAWAKLLSSQDCSGGNKLTAIFPCLPGLTVVDAEIWQLGRWSLVQYFTMIFSSILNCAEKSGKWKMKFPFCSKKVTSDHKLNSIAQQWTCVHTTYIPLMYFILLVHFLYYSTESLYLFISHKCHKRCCTEVLKNQIKLDSKRKTVMQEYLLVVA